MQSVAKVTTPRAHDIPSLDGMRAISIAFVVLSHTKALLPGGIMNSGLFRYLVGGGLHGVQVFFVISGYLITTLLHREFENTGDVSLRAFYVRRTLRIFPPFIVYVIAVGVLWAAGARQDISTFLAAATYTIIYHPHPQGWMLQHTWSLSIEEQFYLFWPAILVIAKRHGSARRIAIAILIAMPFVRLVVAFASAQRTDHLRLMVNLGAIDALMIGCLLALLAREDRWRRWCQRWITSWMVLGATTVGLLIIPYLEAKVGSAWSAYVRAVEYSVAGISIGMALEHLVRNPQSIVGRVVNLGIMRHIGVISYSIYLWQQAFTGTSMRFGAWTYALILLVAEAAFWLVERPSMRLRSRFKPDRYLRDTEAVTSSVARVSVSGLSPNASIQ